MIVNGKKITYIILAFLTTVSVGMLLFRWGIIPPIFGEAVNADDRNEVMLNLSYSYLAGLVFYILVTWLPYNIRSHKMRPFIEEKKKVIKDKIDECAIATIPTAIIIDHKPDRTELISHLEKTSFLIVPTYMSLLTQGSTIYDHWRLKRDEIKTAIADVLEFKEYLTDKELVVLGKIQDCQFFCGINAIFPMTDTPDARRKMANYLCDAIDVAEEL